MSPLFGELVLRTKQEVSQPGPGNFPEHGGGGCDFLESPAPTSAPPSLGPVGAWCGEAQVLALGGQGKGQEARRQAGRGRDSAAATSKSPFCWLVNIWRFGELGRLYLEGWAAVNVPRGCSCWGSHFGVTHGLTSTTTPVLPNSFDYTKVTHGGPEWRDSAGNDPLHLTRAGWL